MKYEDLLKQEIFISLQKVAQNFQVEIPYRREQIRIEIPPVQHGDYSSNIALETARFFKQNPMMISEKIKDELEKQQEKKQQKSQQKNSPKEQKIIQKVEIKSGFLNFFIAEEYRQQNIFSILREKKYGSCHEDIKEKITTQKILIEFVSANPTGPLHIGHARWAVIGDILANIYNYYGFEVDKEFYVNDAGKQIDNLKKSILAVKENTEIPEDGYRGDYIHDLIDCDDPVAFLLQRQQQTLQKIKVTFDFFFHETKLYEKDHFKIKEIFDLLKKEDYTYEKDGALFFASSKNGDDKDRVLIKSDGSYSYFAVDIAYHYNKICRNYHRLINILGADHHGYIKRLESAVKVLSKGKQEIKIIIGQLVNLLKDGKPLKLSKRKGNIILLSDVLEEVEADALRYFLARKSVNSRIDFDIDLAQKKTKENPIFYIQYAHARICSLMKKIEETKSTTGIQMIEEKDFDYSIIASPLSNQLSNMMIRLPWEIEEITKHGDIFYIAEYLYQFANLFHRYYEETPFLKEENKELTSQRLFFLLAVKKIFQICLQDLMNIKAPEEM